MRELTAGHCAEHTLNPVPRSEVRQGQWPTLETLLVSGGGARIALDEISGLNKYGCRPYPDPSLLALGSSTASVISSEGFAVARLLHERLLREIHDGDPADIFAHEFGRIRRELLDGLGLSDVDAGLIFATSGTDAHRIVAQSVAQCGAEPLTIVMVEESETGSGVAAALSLRGMNLLQVSLRLSDGLPRAMANIDTEVSELVEDIVSVGGRVLLIMVDQSKTGLIAPGPACAARLHHRYPGRVEVLVDACQLRLAPPTLRAYLRQGFMVALTGSKFLTGPSFSAALLIPGEGMPQLLKGDDPGLDDFGLLLRWEAALAELHRFNALPHDVVTGMMREFASAILHRLNDDPHFEALPVHRVARQSALPGWDDVQSIFPFLLYRHGPDGRVPLGREQTQQIYRQLQLDLCGNPEFEFAGLTPALASLRCQFGQPVACGMREGVAVSALRLCLSARLISDAAAQNSIAGAIEQALAALDKAAALTCCLPHL